MKWIFISLGILIVLIAIVYLIGLLMNVKHEATIQCEFKKIGMDEILLVITDYKEYTSWRSGIKELTIDSVNHWTEKNSHGDKVSYRLEMGDEKGKLITRILNKDLAYGGFWEFTITSIDDGCSIKIVENGEVYNPLFRFMAKYIFGHETTLKNYVNDLEIKLKAKN
ncbi:MAG: hypothetical protein ACKVOQ_22560 [Cyclobacteriaceae bacterium]